MASEILVQQIVPLNANRVTVGYGISVDADAVISVGSSINVAGNLNIGHVDIQDSMNVESTYIASNDMFGNGDTITNLDQSTTRNYVIAYQYILDPLPFRS